MGLLLENREGKYQAKGLIIIKYHLKVVLFFPTELFNSGLEGFNEISGAGSSKERNFSPDRGRGDGGLHARSRMDDNRGGDLVEFVFDPLEPELGLVQ